LKALKNGKGFPKLIFMGEIYGIPYLVMQKLGFDLRYLIDCGNHFSLKDVVQIGTQIIDRLEYLHELGYLHLDLKLENLLFGSNEV
jgi:serine/threonine protein kinase